MQTTLIRTAGTAAAVAAAALAGFYLHPASQPAAAQATRVPAVEVRTEVIRRTIHIVRHVHAAGAGGKPSPAIAAPGSPSLATSPAGPRPGATATPVKTRTSTHGASAAPTTYAASHSAPVTTRTSAHGTTSGSANGRAGSAPVTTRTSSHHGDDNGGGDD
jgi:hypothetical protein